MARNATSETDTDDTPTVEQKLSDGKRVLVFENGSQTVFIKADVDRSNYHDGIVNHYDVIVKVRRSGGPIYQTDRCDGLAIRLMVSKLDRYVFADPADTPFDQR